MKRVILMLGVLGLLAVVWEKSEPVTVSAPEQEYRLLPIIMYHSILADVGQQGEYVLDPSALEADLIYLLRNHYQTVTISEVIAYVRGTGELPEKSVMITFDDGYYNNYSTAYPILKKYGVRAVLSPVASLSKKFTENKEENVYWSYCTRDQLKELYDSGIFEIANHSYDMHALSPRKGCLKRSGETQAQYREALIQDIRAAQTLLQSYEIPEPICYTYPYGALNKQSEELLQEMGFAATMGCEEGMNVLTRGDEACLYRLKRYNRPSGKNTETFFDNVLE